MGKLKKIVKNVKRIKKLNKTYKTLKKNGKKLLPLIELGGEYLLKEKNAAKK